MSDIDVDGLVERLRERAESYRMGGPSSEHTAALLDEAATALSSERDAHEQTESRLAEVEKALSGIEARPEKMIWGEDSEVREALNDMVDAARRVREGGKADG